MAETLSSLAGSRSRPTPSPGAAPEAPRHVQKLDKQGRAYATGKRKNAVARVWIKPGTRQDHRQRQARSTSISPGRCCA